MDTEGKMEAQVFYKEALMLLKESKKPFLLGGAFAFYNYTGVYRDTKDLDIFCKPGDYSEILKVCFAYGYEVEITDPRWLAKAKKGDFYIDIIFSTANGLSSVNDAWLEHAVEGELFGVPSLRFIAPEELIESKIYVQSRDRYDGSDINHIILKKGTELDWKRLLNLLEKHWQLLLGQLMNFQFVYPSERDLVPEWVINKLIEKVKEQYSLPVPLQKVCRGPLVDHSQYNVDIVQWGYRVVTLFGV